jgi:hypothetical protein
MVRLAELFRGDAWHCRPLYRSGAAPPWQRRFQERNPGYDRRRKARQRARETAALEMYRAELVATAEAQRAAMVAEPLALPEPAAARAPG